MGWLKRVPVFAWIVALAFLVYSNFFAPPALVAQDWWLILGIVLFWASYFGWPWIAGLIARRRS